MISPISLVSLLSPISIPTSFLSSSLHLPLCLSLVSCDPQLCPRIGTIISSLNENLVNNLNGKSQPGEAVGVPSAACQGAGALLYACSTARTVRGPWRSSGSFVLSKSGECGWGNGVPADWRLLLPSFLKPAEPAAQSDARKRTGQIWVQILHLLLATVGSWSTGSTSLILGFLRNERL